MTVLIESETAEHRWEFESVASMSCWTANCKQIKSGPRLLHRTEGLKSDDLHSHSPFTEFSVGALDMDPAVDGGA